ncbi:amidohydrolase family protein [Aestuariicella hydrocarbonica]|uniref:Amidohydrolase family protein n=1 Tax=Pseudomaricurvus hydrocarbonicus TaxID=1470433 RepID=A0A9E5MPU2_9GAMM|nr:amidohydrolase family protein [Aestuariicella hydrocarbonica]NHO68278.1 amidohydrolase family protein [Aestuariicella hydrocarbonica]
MNIKQIGRGLIATLVLPTLVWAGEFEPGEEIITQVVAMGIQPPTIAPPRGEESAGPYQRLVIQNANIIDGAGAPAQGPVTIVIENDRIVDLRGGGTGSMPVSDKQYGDNTRVIDATGKYVLPGFIDAHAHLGTPSHGLTGALTSPEYVNKLWLAHGVTTIREPGAFMGLEWTLKHKQLSDAGNISAPRMKVHALLPENMSSADAARKWVRAVHKKGADGIKFLGAAPDVIAAALDEAHKLNMKTMFHHSQVTVSRMNALDTARQGLDSMEHWYGLPEAMFRDKRVQQYPSDYNYNDEQDRFAEAGRLWTQTASPGSDVWQATIDEMVNLDFTLDPTMTIYEANRDLMRARQAEWMDDYAMPYINRAFQPNPHMHGSFHFDWTTEDEVAWKENYRLWMQFLNDYKNAGGRVTTGSDSGFIYGLYGFGYIRELELLQEAGFHPLEVIQAATLNGAELLGIAEETGSIQIGKKADLVIVNENPLTNFKVLYGTGHLKLNRDTHQLERTQGIVYTIKDGMVFDAKRMLQQVRDMVAERQALEADMAVRKP